MCWASSACLISFQTMRARGRMYFTSSLFVVLQLLRSSACTQRGSSFLSPIYFSTYPSNLCVRWCTFIVTGHEAKWLTHWGRDQMAISQPPFSNAFLEQMNIWISIKISLNFVPKGSINNITGLVQIMAWHRPGDKPLSEPMMVSL